MGLGDVRRLRGPAFSSGNSTPHCARDWIAQVADHIGSGEAKVWGIARYGTQLVRQTGKGVYGVEYG